MNTLKRILTYTKRYWKRLAISGLTTVVYGSFTAGPTIIVKYIVDSVFVAGNVKLLLPFISIFIAMFVLKGIFMYISNYYMQWVGNQVVNNIRHDLFSKIINFPVAFYQKKTSGQLLSYFLNDISTIQVASSTAIRNGIRSFFEAFFLIAVACKQNAHLALLLLVLGPLLGWIIKRMGVEMRSTAGKSQNEMGNLSSVLQETFIGIREIKSFNTEKTETNRFRTFLNKYFHTTMKNVSVVSLAPAFIEIISMTGCGIILYIASMQVIQGSITPGELASFFSAIILAYQPLKRIINVYTDVQIGIAAADRVFDIMDMSYPGDQNRNIELEKFETSIEFKNFSFSYNNETPVLENINLTIKKGESVGIIGPSGSGKSTFGDLILGFIQGQAQTLFIDSKDITKISFNSLRNQIGYVGQKTFLFNDTILANIKYARPDATEEDGIKAAQDAYAHDFIMQLPEGYNTIVGENGMLLSGGQKQRITIARALLKQPEILIFDEATSALDHKSEFAVCAALKEIAKTKTVIIISHRTSIVSWVDRIFSIKDNQIEIAAKTTESSISI